MKKIILIIGIVVVVIVIVVLGVGFLMLDGIILKGVETVGPRITGVPVKVEAVNISLFSGKGRIKGFFVGNPPGYKTDSAIRVGSASVAVVPKSVFGDKVVIPSLVLQDPVVTLDGNLQGNNLSTILNNLEKSSSSENQNQQKAGKKLEIDDLLISGGKIRLNLDLPVAGDRAATVPLPEIHLTDLGRDANGITAAELSQKILRVVLQNATQAASASVTSLGKGILNNATNIGGSTLQNIGKTGEGIKDLFKKK